MDKATDQIERLREVLMSIRALAKAILLTLNAADDEEAKTK